ncbi:MAG: flagellar filament capping protein FliD [Candidatus Nitronauta litoralis]|uniref:Flagellar filament capping protein FliD n=1 Tax=Candidatus Nitronauta litoralis TaxID=2705533 RepID=A0A7T0FZG2_9BACT|nr:MAG: flagellar filament capping protein FliD [Candidatus Nitronauta litoralis]
MQIPSVTGLPLSRLKAPISRERNTGDAETAGFGQVTTRTTPAPRSTDRPGVSLPALPFYSNSSGNPNTLVVSATLNPQRVESAQNGFRQSIRNRLEDLSERVGALLGEGDFTTRNTRISIPEVLNVTPGNQTPLDQFNFSSTRLSSGQVLASDRFTSGSALNLNGSFGINGVTVTVESMDGLSNIRDKINRGEDTNGNGILDGPEDLNANNQIDIIDVEGSEQGPGKFIVEDINGNGVLDPDEDRNNNDRLDGGTEENRVVAGLTNDRLILSSETGGTSAIALSDPDGVLLALGFFELNAKGRPIQKEAQFDFDRQTPTNLNTTPQTASLEINGVTQESDTDDFTESIEDAVVELKKTSDNDIEVRVVFDSENAVEQIISIADDFNRVIRETRRVEEGNPPVVDDPEITRVQNTLTQGTDEGSDSKDASAPEDILNTFDRITPPVSGQPLKDAGVLKFGEFFISDSAQSIEDGIRTEPPENTSLLPDLFKKIGIRFLEDETLEIEKPVLEEAFQNDFDQVRDLFFNEATGLLPQIQEKLEGLLNTDFGPLALSSDPAESTTQPPTNQFNQLRAVIDSLDQLNQERNLLAIV